MSCEPERVSALVDGALDAGAAAALRTHLESCASCRSLAAAEQAVRECLKRLPPPELPLGLVTRARARFRGRRAALPRLVRLVVPLAAVVATALWARGFPPFVAWALSRDHDHCYSASRPPAAVRSGEPGAVEAWFARQGTRLPAVPDRVDGTPLAGGRFCYLADASVTPHLYYFSASEKLSIFVLPHGVRIDQVFRTGSRGNQVALVRAGGDVVGIVSRRSEAVDEALRSFRTTLARAEVAPP